MAAKSFVPNMSVANFSRNVGGLGGGLMALGDVLGAMAMGSANIRPGESVATGVGRGLAIGATGLKESFARGKKKMQDDQFRVFAFDQMEKSAPGSKKQQMWEAVLSENPIYTNLLPNLWNAEAADERTEALKEKARLAATAAGALTPTQMRDNELILIDRQKLARIHAAMNGLDEDGKRKIAELFRTEAYQTMVANARRPLVGMSDPDAMKWHDLATSNPLLSKPGSYEMPVQIGGGLWGFTGGDAAPGGEAPKPGSSTNPRGADVSQEDNSKGLFDTAVEAVTGAAKAVGGILGIGEAEAATPSIEKDPDAFLEQIMTEADPSRAEAKGDSGAKPAVGQPSAPAPAPAPAPVQVEAPAIESQGFYTGKPGMLGIPQTGNLAGEARTIGGGLWGLMTEGPGAGDEPPKKTGNVGYDWAKRKQWEAARRRRGLPVPSQ